MLTEESRGEAGHVGRLSCGSGTIHFEDSRPRSFYFRTVLIFNIEKPRKVKMDGVFSLPVPSDRDLRTWRMLPTEASTWHRYGELVKGWHFIIARWRWRKLPRRRDESLGENRMLM